jgi:selenocysteine lyase/cysteine desulfurase
MKVASIENIRLNVIGSDQTLQGPFGSKPIVYADATASGKSLKLIEDYIQATVLPYYANTHTEASATGLQTSHFREDARRMIRETVKAPAEDYAVLFCGSGSTAAINKMAHVLGISPLSPVEDSPEDRPVVFIGPYEHHSNDRIWRESPVDVVTIPLSEKTGSIDIDQLQRELRRYSDRPLRIGSFSAASNVTGIRSDTRTITKTLMTTELLPSLTLLRRALT